MKYVKVYESPNPEFLEGLLEGLHQDGIKTARINPKDSKILEVSQSEKRRALEIIEADLDIVQALNDAPSDEKFSVDDENRYLASVDLAQKVALPKVSAEPFIFSKLDLLKLGLAMFFFFMSGFFLIFPHSFEDYSRWYMYIFLGPLLVYLYFAKEARALNIPLPLDPKDEAWVLKMKKITKTLVWFFWIIALPMVYLFFRENGFLWEEIISGDKEYILLIVEFLSPIVCIGAVLYLHKIIFHFKKELDPKYFSAQEIEKIKEEKQRVIEEAKRL